MPTVPYSLVANRIALAVEPPDRILLLPWGKVQTDKGELLVDSEGAEATIAAFTAHNVRLVVDYEHSTLGGKYANSTGKAKAAAWITALHHVEGEGLWADVEWTDEGAADVRSKAYRYLSPAVVVRDEDHRVIELHSVALTNKPAIVGMQPVVNKAGTASAEPLETNDMTDEKLLIQLRELVGEDAKADEGKVLAALKAKLGAADALRLAVCKAVKVTDAKAKDEDIVAAVVTACKAAVPVVTPLTAPAPSPLLVEAVADNRRLKLKELALSGHITPAEAEMWGKLYSDPQAVTLALSAGNGGDDANFKATLTVLASRTPMKLGSQTGPQYILPDASKVAPGELSPEAKALNADMDARVAALKK